MFFNMYRRYIVYCITASLLSWCILSVPALKIHSSADHVQTDKDSKIMATKQFDPEKTVYLIDGSSFLYRAYYGLRPLHTKQGEPVQAVYSFCRMIKKIIKDFNPQYLSLVWDSKGKTTRHEMYTEYKATRQEPPSDLFQQKERILEFADLIDLHQVAQPGIEADDLMYSIAMDRVKQGDTVVIITADKDMGQMLQDNIVIFDPFKNEIITQELFEEKMGFPVSKLPFYFALLGDASDNIPGVRGIGKKGAADLVQQFQSLQDLYENIDQVPKERTRKLLLESKDNAFLSEKLFLLQYHTANSESKNLAFDKNEWKHAYPLFKELNFKSLLKELEAEGIKAEPKQKLSEFGNYRFITITTETELRKLCETIKKHGTCAIDTELTGLNPLYNQLVGISVCVENGTAYHIPFGHEVMEAQLDRQTVFAFIKPLMEDATIKKIMHHAKFDMLAFKHYNIETKGLIFDTLLAAHLTTKDWQRVNLKYLSEYYLEEPMLTYGDAVTNNGYKHFGQLPLELATEYAASDAHQTFKLYPLLLEQLREHNMLTLFETIEFPLLFVLYSMQADGIYVDVDVLKQLDEQVCAELERIKEKIDTLVGPEFKNINLNSPQQLKVLLFDHLQLPPQKKTAGKTSYSTDQEVLETLATLHPIPQLILQYRGLFKLKSTYIDALPNYINPETGRVHSTLTQTAVATGRLASSDPNLQNVPTGRIHDMVPLRSAFKPQEGNVFVSADYSQIELRVLAYLSQDEALLSAFEKGNDIHRETAARLFDVTLDEVTHEQRQLGKRINFSILYGLTPYGLSKDLKIPFGEAKIYIEKYFDQYPGVSAWMENVIHETKKNGYVTTHWGRRRYIPAIYEQNKNLYENARRVAINTKAQGTAAELMKQGMIALDHTLGTELPEAHILLQIHDELLISVPEKDAQRAEQITKKVLEHVVDWNVPLEVTVRSGATWYDVSK